MTLTTQKRYWLLSDQDAQDLRSLLTDEALHILESGLHTTPLLPLDEVEPGLSAREFGNRFLKPAAQAADKAGIVMGSIAAEVISENGSFHLGNRTSVTQTGAEDYARSAVRALVGDLHSALISPL